MQDLLLEAIDILFEVKNNPEYAQTNQQQIENIGELQFYVKCKEACDGITNIVPYTIKTCVNPEKDLTMQGIDRVVPTSGAFVKYGETEKNITVWVNEPANCRWDIADSDYDNMVNNMACQTNINLKTWPCTTTLTGLNENSLFYFKCKDQPWLPDTNTSRNKMSQSYPYELSVSSSPLTIIDFKPEYGHEFISGVEPVSVNLNVRTAGGAENGLAACDWQLEGYSFNRFSETFSDFHSDVWDFGFRGNHDINFNCEDVAGNNVSASTSFDIKIDTTGPRIIRVYFKDGLKVVTNEEAECRYDFTRSFDFDEANIMSGDGIEHVADWQLKTYYIQCKDQFDRKGGKIRVKAYDLL